MAWPRSRSDLDSLCKCRHSHLIPSYTVITGRGGRKGRKHSTVSWRDPSSRWTLSITSPASIVFITVVSERSLFCSVIWDQPGGISSKQTWIRTFIMAQLASLPTPSSHTHMGRLQRKQRGWRCRLLSHWGLRYSILFPSHMFPPCERWFGDSVHQWPTTDRQLNPAVWRSHVCISDRSPLHDYMSVKPVMFAKHICHWTIKKDLILGIHSNFFCEYYL